MYLSLGNFIIVSVTLFTIGLVGFLANRKNILLLLLSLVHLISPVLLPVIAPQVSMLCACVCVRACVRG